MAIMGPLADGGASEWASLEVAMQCIQNPLGWVDSDEYHGL